MVDGLYLNVLGRPGVAFTGEVMVRQVAGVREERKGGRRGRKEGRRGELVLPHTCHFLDVPHLAGEFIVIGYPVGVLITWVVTR